MLVVAAGGVGSWLSCGCRRGGGGHSQSLTSRTKVGGQPQCPQNPLHFLRPHYFKDDLSPAPSRSTAPPTVHTVIDSTIGSISALSHRVVSPLCCSPAAPIRRSASYTSKLAAGTHKINSTILRDTWEDGDRLVARTPHASWYVPGLPLINPLIAFLLRRIQLTMFSVDRTSFGPLHSLSSFSPSSSLSRTKYAAAPPLRALLVEAISHCPRIAVYSALQYGVATRGGAPAAVGAVLEGFAHRAESKRSEEC
jgi:hypothetical protein